MTGGKESRKTGKLKKKKRQSEQTKRSWEGRGWRIPAADTEAAKPVCLAAAAHPTTSSSRQGDAKTTSQRASAAQLTAPRGHYLSVGEAALKCRSWAAEMSCYFRTSISAAPYALLQGDGSAVQHPWLMPSLVAL